MKLVQRLCRKGTSVKTSSCLSERSYPAVVGGHQRLQRAPLSDPLPRPAPESHRPGQTPQRRSCRPQRRVQAVDGDVLHGLGAQQVEEVHLDPVHAHLQLQRIAVVIQGLFSADKHGLTHRFSLIITDFCLNELLRLYL